MDSPWEQFKDEREDDGPWNQFESEKEIPSKSEQFQKTLEKISAPYKPKITTDVPDLASMAAAAGDIIKGPALSGVLAYTGKATENLYNTFANPEKAPKEAMQYLTDPIKAGIYAAGGSKIGRGITDRLTTANSPYVDEQLEPLVKAPIEKGISYISKGADKAGAVFDRILQLLGPESKAIKAYREGRINKMTPNYPELAKKMGSEANRLAYEGVEGSKTARALLGSKSIMSRDHGLAPLENVLESFKYKGQVTNPSSREAINKLDDLLQGFKNLPEELSEQDVKHIIDSIDKNRETWKDQIPKDLAIALRQLRHGYDQVIKINEPYRKAMVPVNIRTTIGKQLREKFGLKTEPGASDVLLERLKPGDSTAGAIKNSVNENKLETRNLLGRLENVTGSNFPKMAENHRLSQQFNRGATQGSRRVNMFSKLGKMMGRVAGSGEGSAQTIGEAGGGVLGGLLDNLGGRVTRKILDTYLAGKEFVNLGPYENMVNEAARRGPTALSVLSSMLSQDPDFRKQMRLEE